MKKFIIIILVISLNLISCVTTNNSMAEDKNQETDNTPVLSDARPDITAVVTALSSSIISPENTLSGPVIFHTETLISEKGPGKEFSMTDIFIDEDIEKDQNPLFRKLTGIIKLSDNYARESYWAFAAEYLIQDEGILILSSASEPLYSQFSRIQFYFVEPDQLPPLKYLENAEYKELLPLVAENATDPLKLKNLDSVEKLYLFVFDMTKSNPSSDLKLYSNGSIADNAVTYSKAVNNNGWRFIMADGLFRLGHKADYSFFVSEGDKNPRVLAALSAKL